MRPISAPRLHAALRVPMRRSSAASLLASLLVFCLASLPAGAAEEVPPEDEEVRAVRETADAELVFAVVLADLQQTRAALGSRVAARSDPREVDRAYDDVVDALARGGAKLREAMSAGAEAQEVDALARELGALNDLRIEALQSVTPAKRERVLGLSREGIDQLVREISHLALVVEWYPGSRLRQIEELPPGWVT